MTLTRRQVARRLLRGKGVVRSVHMDDDLAAPCSCIEESPSSSILPVKSLECLGNFARNGLRAARSHEATEAHWALR
jgi:hypothetical protein